MEQLNKYATGQVLLVNKPYGWTSFDVIRKIRSLIKVKKVGHAGTLDPLATGLLIVCTGAFTRRISEYMSQEKEYTGTFTVGATTPTYDLESTPTNLTDYSALTETQIIAATEQFTGYIDQVPPAHSAIKKDGRRLYELARQGRDVIVEPRKVLISEFEITAIELPQLHFRIVCSTGTYIRSVANDYGRALGCGAYLSNLCRTRIGTYSVAEAETLDELERRIRSEQNSPGTTSE